LGTPHTLPIIPASSVLEFKRRSLLLVVVVVVVRARSQGSGCTAAIRLIVHPVFYKFPLSPSDVSTFYATREIQATRGGTLMGEKD
jgi:hypothetical protein